MFFRRRKKGRDPSRAPPVRANGRSSPVQDPPRYRVSGVEVMTDVAPARWIEESLSEFGHRVGCVIPEGFEAYVRVLHPARVGSPEGERWIRWSEVAAMNGRRLEEGIAFDHVAAPLGVESDPWRRQYPWGDAPRDGTLLPSQCAALSRVLRPHTATPSTCWFGLWAGFGGLGAPPEKELPLFGSPALRESGRAYILYRGPIEAIVTAEARLGGTPQLWWPDDRAWCVASEIDSMWTYVGGARALIDDIAVSPDLETLPTAIEARF